MARAMARDMAMTGTTIKGRAYAKPMYRESSNVMWHADVITMHHDEVCDIKDHLIGVRSSFQGFKTYKQHSALISFQ